MCLYTVLEILQRDVCGLPHYIYSKELCCQGKPRRIKSLPLCLVSSLPHYILIAAQWETISFGILL